jgi:hypothetical protein
MVTRATYSLVPPSLLCFAYAGELYAADKRRVTPIMIESLMIPLIGDQPRGQQASKKGGGYWRGSVTYPQPLCGLLTR